ncbi:B12-binding domain-containing radical SAM protein [Elusimicrobiota bacterium]
MRILLIQPFKDPGLSGESYPPVGLGFLANSLRKSAHEVRILDCLKDNLDFESFEAFIKKESPDLVGISLYSISIPFLPRMLDAIKRVKSDTVVVLGGPHVSSLPHGVLNSFEKVDYAIRGEGEIAIRKLADTLEMKKKDFNGIPGLIYRDKGEVRVNEPYFPKNIEEYGIPAWDLLRPREYFKYLGVGKDTVPVFFSRGCPFPCTFCAAKVTSGQRLRRRGLDHIFEELHLLQREHGIKKFVIEDEGFGVDKRFIMDFCDRVKKDNLKAIFAMGVGMRLDIVDEELLNKMKDSGFERTIVLGIESGSERILGLMKKKTNLKMIRSKVDFMDKMGFNPCGYFILGYPSETREEMEQTVQLALKLKIREASFTAFQPLPNTEATQALMETGELPKDFDFAVVGQNAITYAPKGMSIEELAHIRKNAILRFYMRPRVLLSYFTSKHRFVYAFKKFSSVFLKKNVVRA